MDRSRVITIVLLCLLFCAWTAPAQGVDRSAPPSYVPEELLERPLPLRSHIGNSHEEVTTSSPEAQRYYDQGLDYLQSFFWIEAARSFHQALRIDPRVVLAYVGLSSVHSELDNPAGARYYLDLAKTFTTGAGAIGPKISKRERAFLEIREKQLAAREDVNSWTKREAYRKAVDDALAQNRDDPELWLLAGIASEPNARGRGQRGAAASIAFYERVLMVAPNDASAHHYLIHTYEAIGPPDSAVAHARIYLSLASSIPHAAHMMGHALRRAGRLDEAIAEYEKSDALERAYYAAERIDPSLDWHHEHNLEVLVSCYEEKGAMDLAENAARELSTLGRGEAYRAFNRKELPAFLLRRRRYEEASREAEVMSRDRYPQARAVGHALMGRALIGLGKSKDAARELEAAERELEKIPRNPSELEPDRSDAERYVRDLREDYRKKTLK